MRAYTRARTNFISRILDLRSHLADFLNLAAGFSFIREDLDLEELNARRT
jgi:hypothetical protein